MILGSPRGAAPLAPIRRLQHDLASIGLGVRLTGRLDRATVDAVNSVLSGWDDAPAALRTGKLSMHDVAAHIGDVSRYVHQAVGGAMTVAAG